MLWNHVVAHLTQWLLAYGYTGVFVLVALESLALPLPGETVLVTAAIYAGKTHHLRIGLLITTAALGVIAGGIAGFFLGRKGGHQLLRKYRTYLHLDDARLRLGQYLFSEYGGRVVFFGRFVALLRSAAAFLAGVNHMAPGRFFAFHVAGAVTWAAIFGLGGYLLGDQAERVTSAAGLTIGAVGGAALILGAVYIKHHLEQLQLRADRHAGCA